MNNEGEPTHQDKPTAAELEQTRFQVVLEYDLPHQRLAIKSKCPTVMLEGILSDALSKAKLRPGALPEDGRVTVTIDYDMVGDKLTAESQAPRIVTRGIIQHALGAVTRNQVTQMFQVYKAGMEKRVAELEADLAKRKILIPGR